MDTFLPSLASFDHVHVGIVGQLPPSQGFCYLLTIVNRFTRWPEAIPISEIIAQAVARFFVSGWVSPFGVPSTVTTNRGRQFEPEMLQQLMKLIGSSRVLTTAYHPASNGLVERFHPQLKASLMAQSIPGNWVDHLTLVLLGIRSTLKTDLGCCTAEPVYGSALCLTGEFLESSLATVSVCLLRGYLAGMLLFPAPNTSTTSFTG